MFSCLLAEVGSTESIWQMIIAFVVGGGALKLLDWYQQYRKNRLKDDVDARDKERREKLEDDERDRARTDRYIERLQRDHDDLRRENHDLRDRMQVEVSKAVRERIKAEKRAVWIKSMEAHMRAQGMDFPEWKNGPSEMPEEGDSGVVRMHGPSDSTGPDGHDCETKPDAMD